MKLLVRLALIGSVSASLLLGACLPGASCEEEASSSTPSQCLPGTACGDEAGDSSQCLPGIKCEEDATPVCPTGSVETYFQLFECLPGETTGNCQEANSIYFDKVTVDAIIEQVLQEVKERFGGVEDYFEKRDEKEYFTREVVDQIVEKTIAQCRQDPKQCGIEALPIQKVSTPVDVVVEALAGKEVPINGYYLHYGPRAFDWVYVSKRSKAVMKLEKGIGEDYVLQWTPIHTPTQPMFSDVIIGEDTIYFGPKVDIDLPGMAR
ncbi:MAG: hypothetical protein C6I00_01025 [Nitratiruptor sp.]|nr:hypothetical protein [Nitratiruptor sp.]NPA83179.1 hypothetical protein [Campylobacterota bacterium]